MSEQQLRDMFAYASDSCERMFAKNGVILPMWHAVTESGEQLVMKPPHPDKDAGVAMIRAWFELRNVVRYIFIDEAWILIRKGVGIPPEEMDRIHREGLSQHPERIEVVMISGEDSECGQIMAHRRIFRPVNRKPYLGPLQWTDEVLPRPIGAVDHSEGRMVGLLPVRGMRQ